jgi:16S rRNA (cytosine967-C5)-methyltransferase
LSATPARVAALDTLRAIRDGALADRALFAALERVSPRDRPWTQELVYGTLRLRGRIDYMLAQLVRQSLERLEPDILDVLRLGAYQLLEMHSVPAYAAVSQSVELAKSFSNPGAARLVNGVLQSLRRAQADLSFPAFETDPVGHLSTWGSHPRWLVERWVVRFGVNETRALIESNNRRPDLYLLPLRDSSEEAIERLRNSGIDARPVETVPGSLHLPSCPPGAPAASAALAALPSIVQDPAATLVVRYADAGARAEYVADLASAPGGKALALAAARDHTSLRHVVACDISYDRIQRVRQNSERVGIPLAIVVSDGRRPALRERAFDLVLLDAPCTGTGTFRRHPDGRWRVGVRDLEQLTQLQRELLRAAAPLVKQDGVLVYATCSLEVEENERQVEMFLEEHTEFAAAPPPVEADARFIDDEGHLVVLPQHSGFDGSFAARLRRN